VARAIRQAYPRARITGLDYWSGSSGIHHNVFDDVIILPSWDLIDEATHIAFLNDQIDRGTIYLPTLDLEVAWLADHIDRPASVLAPSRSALAHTGKPRASIAEMLPVSVPEFLPLSAGDEAVFAFCRRHSWRVWIKGPYHEAIFVSSWRSLEGARQHLQQKWGAGNLFVQAHKKGLEESLCFSAVNGKLIDAVYMEKRITTPDGKTWSGKISAPSPQLRAALTRALAATGFHGGGEIELLRTSDNELWFNELNPRFPAWIFGTAIAGINLPAMLIEQVSGIRGERSEATTDEFTRVVTEIPVSAHTALPVPAEPLHGQVSMAGKYGAGMSALVEKISRGDRQETFTSVAQPETQDRSVLADLATIDPAATPQRVFLKQTSEENFARVRNLHSRYSNSGFRSAYSLKTCCDEEVLAAAREAGMLAECISLYEVDRALAAGWRPDEVVLNGPAKWWPYDMRKHDCLYAVFCDSLEELARLQATDRRDSIWGARIRLPGFSSRFGIDLGNKANFEKLCAEFSTLPDDKKIGLHFHLASNLIGNTHWQDAVDSLTAWARATEACSGRNISVIDLGGGYHPDDLDRMPWDDIITYLHRSLPHLERIMIEPGRAVTQNAMAVVSTVLDIRRSESRRGHCTIDEIVLDACIAELPLIAVYPHRFFLRKADGSIRRLSAGTSKVLGRICMEDDILSPGLKLPESLQIGDNIIIGDAGAYERSMSYEFGRGRY
jgi:diaminopimelate decarboxylase